MLEFLSRASPRNSRATDSEIQKIKIQKIKESNNTKFSKSENQKSKRKKVRIASEFRDSKQDS